MRSQPAPIPARPRDPGRILIPAAVAIPVTALWHAPDPIGGPGGAIACGILAVAGLIALHRAGQDDRDAELIVTAWDGQQTRVPAELGSVSR